MSTPRYIMSTAMRSNAPTYEFPLQATNQKKPSATLAVESEQGFPMALLNAIAWAETFSVKQHLPIYPKVRYGEDSRLVKRVAGNFVWTETPGDPLAHGAWVPLGSLSL